jgi:hypothetical protein
MSEPALAPAAPAVATPEPAAPAPAAAAAAAAATPTPAPAAPAPSSGFLAGTPPPAATPPATPSHFFGEHIQKDGQFAEGWTESLRAAGFERLANTAATVKDEAALLRRLDETIGFVGKKTTGITYPKEGASDADISAFRHEAGVPDTPDGYELKPAQLPDNVQWNDAEMAGYAEIFHKHHVPKAAAQELLARHLEQVSTQAGQIGEQFNAKISQFAQTSEATFQKEWGENYDSRLEANKAFTQARFTPEELADPALQAALSHPKIVRVIDEARRALREAPLPGVGTEITGGNMNPRQQAVAIMSANPGWRKDAALNARVNELYALQAAHDKRGAKK